MYQKRSESARERRIGLYKSGHHHHYQRSGKPIMHIITRSKHIKGLKERYYNKAQHVNARGNPLVKATKQYLNYN